MRLDIDNVPRRVQNVLRARDDTFQVTLFDGRHIILDLWTVRDSSWRRYDRWNEEADEFAVDAYVDCIWHLLTPTHSTTWKAPVT